MLVRLLQLVTLVFTDCRLFDIEFTLFGAMLVVIVVIMMDSAGFFGFVAFEWQMQKPNLAARLGKAFFRLYFDDDDVALHRSGIT